MSATESLKLTLENLGSLITIAGTGRCLGGLMYFPGHGVYCPNNGRVDDVTPEQADAHNAALDKARIKGLDRCEVGQCGTFYLQQMKHDTDNGWHWSVCTFSGKLVTADVTVRGNSITFKRSGRVFRGRRQKDADCFNFRRVS